MLLAARRYVRATQFVGTVRPLLQSNSTVRKSKQLPQRKRREGKPLPYHEETVGEVRGFLYNKNHFQSVFLLHFHLDKIEILCDNIYVK